MADLCGTLSVSLADAEGNPGRCTVKVPEKKATEKNAKKVADFMKEHSDARVVSYGLTRDYSGDSTSEGKYDMCYQRLELLYEDGDGKPRRFGIPAPRDEDVNTKQQPESDLAEDVKDLLNEIGAGKDWVYNGGGMKSRMPGKSARDKEMTGV
jgi:hypothetical protein